MQNLNSNSRLVFGLDTSLDQVLGDRLTSFVYILLFLVSP